MLAASGNGQTDLESDITRLKAWYQILDNELQATISAFSHKDLTKIIVRGGFNSTVEWEIGHYGEVLLIFLARLPSTLRR